MVADDVKHSQAEARYHALAKTIDGRRLHVTFTLRANRTKIRVISARDMNRKEREIYEQEA
ncbi:MAG TPA: BrnT family toxin [Xanthobacteraceae bacterium]|nr:BrnT family toxin [Xanthobacteraceae bacterium]